MQFLKLLLFVVIYLHSLVFSVKLNNEDRIVGGVEIAIEDAPWQVSLHYNGIHRCGGFIISKDWVLTAGHCTYRLSLEPFIIRLGSKALKTGGILSNVSEIHIHPSFNRGTLDYDYSLMKLKTSLEFNDVIHPIPLPDIDKHDVVDETLCTISGWGATLNENESGDYLRAAEVPIVNQDSCKASYESKGLVTPRMICAGFEKGGKDSCAGDSGGPLTCLDPVDDARKVYGIVSWGYGCAMKGYPGVYARVSAGRQWINDIISI